MSQKIDAVRDTVLGIQGENLVRHLQWDVTDWLRLCPDGHITISVKRPGETEIYPAQNLTVQNGILAWTITSTETALSGYGAAEVAMSSGDRLIKSRVIRTLVLAALDGTMTEEPDSTPGWLDTARQINEQAIDLLDCATSVMELTEQYNGNAKAYADSAETNARRAEIARDAVAELETSAELLRADAAQSAATAAESMANAKDSEDAAAGSAAAAADSQGAALVSEGKALQSATAAAQSEAKAQLHADLAKEIHDEVADIKSKLDGAEFVSTTADGVVMLASSLLAGGVP